MSNPVLIRVNPDVLKWAREESGYSIRQLTLELNLDENQYRQWETTGSDIPFSVLREISKTLKRQVAVFFLPYIPKKVKRPTDYRNLAVSSRHLSFDSMLAIRRVGKFRELLAQINGNSYYQSKYSWLADFQSSFGKQPLDNKRTVDALRSVLGYSLEQQIEEKSISDSYNTWRTSFEERLGVCVFQLSMPMREIQGFSYSNVFPYCVAVNAKYPAASRIFSLFHELGHILKRQSGLCIPDDVAEDQSLEFECNSFAGTLLVPDDVVQPTTDKNEIYKLATRLKVSSEVYLRRLKTLQLVSDYEFFRLLQEIRSSVKPSGFGILTQLERSRNSRGHTLFNSVLDALNKKMISYERASDILGIKISHIMNA